MVNFLEEIKNLEEKLKQKKEILKSVVTEIKEHQSQRFYTKSDEDDFRHAFMLMAGQYATKYGLGSSLPKNYDISRNTNWETKEYNKYYNIYKRDYYDTFKYDSNNVGFICKKEDILIPIKYYLNSIWKHLVLNDNYIKSLEEFTNILEGYTPDLVYLVFEKYIYSLKEEYFLTIINHKQTKVKDIVIFINKQY